MSNKSTDRNWGDIWHRVDGSWAAHDHVRHFMYEALCETLEKVAWEQRPYEMAEIGTRDPTSSIARILMWILTPNRLTVTAYNYPEVDLHKTTFPDNVFDITVADQVLEHTERPWVCAEELWRITRAGGLTIVATPIIHPIHPNPLDVWRIMPDGYKVIFPESRWEWLTLGMWGDRHLIGWECESPITRGLTGDWLPVAQAKESIPNYGPGTDGVWPVVIWYIGRKR